MRAKRIALYAYVGSALFAFVGALLLMPQVGSGNAAAGTTYTLTSIAAVVLGGASIFGGRGSFVGAVLGAALIVQITTVVQFLELVGLLAAVRARRADDPRRRLLLQGAGLRAGEGVTRT